MKSEKATATQDSIQKLNQKIAKALYKRGQLKHDQGDFQGAMEDLHESMIIDPQNLPCYKRKEKKIKDESFEVLSSNLLATFLGLADPRHMQFGAINLMDFLGDIESENPSAPNESKSEIIQDNKGNYRRVRTARK